MDYLITLSVKADDLRDAEDIAEGIADEAEAIVVRVRPEHMTAQETARMLGLPR